MADNGKDSKRATFNDPAHPLRTDDAAAQKEVAERIREAKKGHKRKHPRIYTDARGVYHIGIYAPMGEHPRVSDTLIGKEWGLKQSQTNKLINSPRDIDPFQTRVLCNVLGVTRKWLRYGGENAFGKYEDPDMIAAAYELLDEKDKETITYLIKRMLGPEQYAEAEWQIWRARYAEWLERHPKERRKAEEYAKRYVQEFRDTVEEVTQRIQREILEATAPMAREWEKQRRAEFDEAKVRAWEEQQRRAELEEAMDPPRSDV